jgi:hypothetical protein
MPDNSQNFNRYSYALNNPLVYTDPSGYSIQTHPDYDTMDEWVTPSGWGFGRIIGQYNYTNYQYMVTPMSAYRFNWATGEYTDQEGNVVSFNEVKSNILYSNAISVDSWAEAYMAVGFADEYIEAISGSVQAGIAVTATFSDNSSLIIQMQNGGSYSEVFNSPSQTGYASSGGGFGNVVSGFGFGGAVASNMDGTFRLTKGGTFSPKYYSSGWKGGSPARIATYSVSKIGTGVSTGASALSTGLAYYDIYSEGAQPITYVDATVGTVGLSSSIATYFSGAQIPGVGYFVAIYGAARLGWDIGWNLGVRYGPSTWLKPKQPKSRVLKYMRQNGMLDD